MNRLIILAHPNPGSFNHAIARTAEEALRNAGHRVTLHDLYQERFDPILHTEEIPLSASVPEPIATHCREAREADGIVIVHPNWWGQPPAILKGWVDRVIRPGVAYRFRENDNGEGVPIGLLKAKAAIVFNTANTPEEREREVFGDPLENIWKRCVFELCGVNAFHRRMYRIIVTSAPEQRREWLDEVARLCAAVFPGHEAAT